MLYLDASIILALLLEEPGSERLQNFLESAEPEGLAISGWIDAEVAGALSLKVRTELLSAEQQSDITAVWRRWRHGLIHLPIGAAHFEVAADYAGRPDLALRAADALHLAVAQTARCKMVTFDRGMARAATQLGVQLAGIGLA